MLGIRDAFTGPRLIVSRMLGQDFKQFRFPRTKNKRIRKKWAKDSRNWRLTWVRACYKIGNDIVCDPLTYVEIQNRLRSNV